MGRTVDVTLNNPSLSERTPITDTQNAKDPEVVNVLAAVAICDVVVMALVGSKAMRDACCSMVVGGGQVDDDGMNNAVKASGLNPRPRTSNAKGTPAAGGDGIRMPLIIGSTTSRMRFGGEGPRGMNVAGNPGVDVRARRSGVHQHRVRRPEMVALIQAVMTWLVTRTFLVGWRPDELVHTV